MEPEPENDEATLQPENSTVPDAQSPTSHPGGNGASSTALREAVEKAGKQLDEEINKESNKLVKRGLKLQKKAGAEIAASWEAIQLDSKLAQLGSRLDLHEHYGKPMSDSLARSVALIKAHMSRVGTKESNLVKALKHLTEQGLALERQCVLNHVVVDMVDFNLDSAQRLLSAAFGTLSSVTGVVASGGATAALGGLSQPVKELTNALLGMLEHKRLDNVVMRKVNLVNSFRNEDDGVVSITVHSIRIGLEQVKAHGWKSQEKVKLHNCSKYYVLSWNPKAVRPKDLEPVLQKYLKANPPGKPLNSSNNE